MLSIRAKVFINALLTGAFLAGCGGSTEYYAPEPDPYYQRVIEPGRVQPASEAERSLLASLSELAANEPFRVEGVVFVAGEPYVAASGVVCRSIATSRAEGATAERQRLACTDQSEWYFVPDIQRLEAVEESP